MTRAARSLALVALLAPVTGQDRIIYAEPPTTQQGCVCREPCTTNLLFQCSVLPFCGVKQETCEWGSAEWSLTHGYYDYCVFPEYRPYEGLTAAEKHAMLLERVRRDTTADAYPILPLIFPGIVAESVMVSFDAQADVFPQPRRKYIHSVGVVAPFTFHSTGGHGYTGLFRTGTEHGLIRLSSAKQPTSSYIPPIPGPGFTPGFGVKLLRDGRPSANFVAMPSLDGQPCSERNYFEHPFTNHVPETKDFGLKLIAAKFWQASYCPQMVGLSDIASEGGPNASAPVFPWKLVLQPPPTAKVDCPCDDYAKCLDNLGALKPGADLFWVLAAEKPGAEEKLIGRFVLTGRFTTSKFGDEELFFRHQRMEDDFALRPQWLHEIDKKAKCGMGCASDAAPTVDKGCHSPFNTTDFGGQLSTDVNIMV